MEISIADIEIVECVNPYIIERVFIVSKELGL